MTEFTPGPWMLHDMEFATVVTETKPGAFIALCHAQYSPRELSEANANLIAAAPTMYNFVASRAGSGDNEAIAIMEAINGNP